MTREQVTDQQSEQDAGTSVAAANGDIYGLPPHLYGQIKSLKYGDAPGLKVLLDLHSELSKQILGVASSQIGMSATKKAIAMTEQNRVGRPGSLSKAEYLPGGEFEIESDHAPAKEPEPTPAARAEEPAAAGGATPVAAGGATPLAANDQADIGRIAGDAFDATPAATAEAPAKKKEPAWVASAHMYNAVHAETVFEFNSLTHNECALDGVNNDPLAIAAWQQKHGLVADGKVGPQTLAAARKVTAQAGPAGAPAADAQIPV